MENYIIANCTDTGRVRSVNEDSMVTFDSPNGRVVVVCDGLGGQNAGDVASQLAVAVIQDILTDNTFNTPEEAICKSINAANQAILLRATQNPEYEGMGSTCVMIIIKDGKVYYGSVGDSRIYYVANHMIRQITKDQSYVQTLVDEGHISQEDAEHHQDKNQIMNALGLATMKPAVIGNMPITPELGCIFVLCSDGLSGMVSNNVILNTVSRHDLSLQERAQLLVRQANEAGGQDNITVQLVEFPTTGAVMMDAYGAEGSGSAMNGGAKKNNTLVYTILVVLLLVVVAFCVYWFHFKPKPKPKQEQERPKVETTIKTRMKQNTVKKTTTTERVIVVEEKEEPKSKTPKKSSKKNAAKQISGKQGTDAKDRSILDSGSSSKSDENNQEVEYKYEEIIDK